MGKLSKGLREALAPPEQKKSLEDVFTEEPVPLTEFIQGRRYLANPPLSPIQYDAVLHAERVYYPDLYPLMGAQMDPYWATEVRSVNFVDLLWGKGSGKDHVARVISLRVAYLLVCLRSPQDYYGLPDQDFIHLLNVASTAPQANRAFFQPMTSAVSRGWFADHAEPTQGAISYDKHVMAISGHSEAETQEGLNLILGVADEIDAFPSAARARTMGGKEPLNTVEGVLNMLRSSATTRFPGRTATEAPVFKNVRISYPRYVGSPIERLVADGKRDIEVMGDKSRRYVSGPLATWQVNPRVHGKEAFADDYREDPVMARAKYECAPALAISPYFRNGIAVNACFGAHAQGLSIPDYTWADNAWSPDYEFAPHLVPISGANYAMHADLAITGDAAGVAMSHVARWEEVTKTQEGERGEITSFVELRPVVVVDFVAHWSASLQVEPAREVQIRWARQLAFELIRRGFNVTRFSFDGFQCLSGDTPIPLLDGTTRTMAELEGSEPFWVYSIHNGRIVPGRCVKAWKTGYRTDMVAVELDNGEVIRATADHRFMLRDGTYRMAGELSTGDSLMPLYRRSRKVSPSSQDYEQVWHPEADGSGKRWRFTHSMVSHHCYGPVPKGSVTHHRDVNPRNNTPENLVQLTNAEHSAEHARMAEGRFAALWADPVWRDAHVKRISAAQSALQEGKSGKDSRRYRHDVSIEDVEVAYVVALSKGDASRQAVQALLGCSQDVLYARVRDAGYRSWEHYREEREVPSRAAMAQRRHKAKQATNHKVVSVTRSYDEDVYDLEVEEFHNFAVGQGVFVHNSADSIQILEAHGVESEKVSTDRTDELWKNLRDLMYEGRVHIGQSPDLLRELLSLDRLPNGKVDHPPAGSKDLADALAGSVHGAVLLGGEETGEQSYWDNGAIEVGTGFEYPEGLPEGPGELVAWYGPKDGFSGF